MLELLELRRLFEVLGTPPAGRKLIEESRRTAPVRQVRSKSSNVITRFFSQKMARMIDSESRTVEHPAVVMYEHDPKILEFYPQPVLLDLKWQGPGEKKPSRVQHTPDFLLLREDGFWIEEWREESRLEKLHAKNPNRIFKENSHWRYPPVEEYLTNLGIGYRLRSALEHPRTYIQNLEFLSDYLSPKCQGVERDRLLAMLDQFQERAAIPLLHLLGRGRSEPGGEANSSEFSADDVYKSIADGTLCFDLMNDLLSETRRVMVYRDRPSLELARSLEPAESLSDSRLSRRDVSIAPGCLVDYDGSTYSIVRVGGKSATLQSQDSTFDLTVTDLLDKHHRGILTVLPKEAVPPRDLATVERLSPTRIEEILTRKAWLEQAENDPTSVPRSARTLQRYRAMIRKAGDYQVDQRLALASRIQDRGNRTRRIPPETVDLIARITRDHYNTPRNISKTTAYRFFQKACKDEEVPSCSMVCFNKELDRHKSTRSRQGKRVAYQEEPVTWYLKLEVPVHGVRPFQFVHIDHTQLDVLLVSAETLRQLGKPWLTLAIDAESRMVMGFYLTFDPPSYRSCMMVLRDLVRRHGQMPAMFVLDNGKEFHSRALARVCELYGCSLRYRPGGRPEFGAVMERMFGTTNDQFIHQLTGNTQLMKHARSVTKSVLPENFSEWTLPMLHGGLEYFFYSLYGTTNHSAHGETPQEHFERRVVETGARQHRLVRFDDLFRIETCPPPPDTHTRLVDIRRGVKVQHLWFWNDVFTAPGMKKKEVEVRMDPWDPGTVYALVKDRWVQCQSKLQPILSNYTETERRYLFHEIAAKYGNRISSLSAHRLEEWLQLLESKNFDPKLTEQQQQGKDLYGPMGMSKAKGGGANAIIVPFKPSASKPSSKPKKAPPQKEDSGTNPENEAPDDYSLF